MKQSKQRSRVTIIVVPRNVSPSDLFNIAEDARIEAMMQKDPLFAPIVSKMRRVRALLVKKTPLIRAAAAAAGLPVRNLQLASRLDLSEILGMFKLAKQRS